MAETKLTNDELNFLRWSAEGPGMMISSSLLIDAASLQKLGLIDVEDDYEGVIATANDAGRRALHQPIHAYLDALAESHGYDMPGWTADELAIDVAMSAAALDGRDPVTLEPACAQWLQRRKG